MVGCATVLGVLYRGHDVFLCVVIGETAAAGTNNKSRETRITPVHTTRNITDGTVIIIFIIIFFCSCCCTNVHTTISYCCSKIRHEWQLLSREKVNNGKYIFISVIVEIRDCYYF